MAGVGAALDLEDGEWSRTLGDLRGRSGAGCQLAAGLLAQRTGGPDATIAVAVADGRVTAAPEGDSKGAGMFPDLANALMSTWPCGCPAGKSK